MPPLNCDLSVDGEHIFICVFWKSKIWDTGPTLIKYFEIITYINEFNKYWAPIMCCVLFVLYAEIQTWPQQTDKNPCP